jgi:hypothetical protein
MSKIILHIEKPVTELEAVNALRSVIVQGKISDNGNSYCYAARFAGGYMVVTRGTQTNGTTTFRVYKES